MGSICYDCAHAPCVMQTLEKTKCPDYQEGKPRVFNHRAAIQREQDLKYQIFKLKQRIEDLEGELKRLKGGCHE